MIWNILKVSKAQGVYKTFITLGASIDNHLQTTVSSILFEIRRFSDIRERNAYIAVQITNFMATGGLRHNRNTGATIWTTYGGHKYSSFLTVN